MKKCIQQKVLVWAIMGFSVGIFTCTPLALYNAINPRLIMVSLLLGAVSSAIVSASAFYTKVVELTEGKRLALVAFCAVNALGCMFVCGWNCNSKLGGAYAAVSFLAAAAIISISQRAYFMLKANR
ncbi:MAG: hypothetical protein FWG30_10065 [Eubacteriaceae bacterium]|nr:hypothetical protein [Eubacteriaceae bacterium]